MTVSYDSSTNTIRDNGVQTPSNLVSTPANIQAYVAGGGTLVNGQIPTQTAPTGLPTSNSPIPDAIPVDTLSAPTQTPPVLPSTPSNTTGSSLNESVPSPSADSIIATDTSPTPAETQQTGYLQKIASLVGLGKSQDDLTTTAETNAGVPALTKTVNDLTTQLEGLNNQATDLQNKAGLIPVQTDQNFAGSGATTGGVAPISAAATRENAIQQSAIASQALTLKSALYGAQGNLSLAKDAADKAATAQYEDQQQQIDYQKALLDALAPSLNDEQKAQAAKLQSDLADRQATLNNNADDKKTIIAMATATLKLYPNDPVAHYAATQALAESNKATPDLTKVLGLVGQYQADPEATAKAIADLKNEQADTAYKNAQTNSLNNPKPTTSTTTDTIDTLINTPYSASNAIINGKYNPDADVKIMDDNGDFTSKGFQSLLNLAQNQGMDRQDFITKYKKYFPANIAKNTTIQANYGLSAADVKLL